MPDLTQMLYFYYDSFGNDGGANLKYSCNNECAGRRDGRLRPLFLGGLALGVAILLAACAEHHPAYAVTLQAHADPYVGRNGEAEALADLASGKALKLYSHVYAGERGGFRTPGLLYCDPDQNRGDKAAEALFAPLPEANVSESITYSSDQ